MKRFITTGISKGETRKKEQRLPHNMRTMFGVIGTALTIAGAAICFLAIRFIVSIFD